jgi:hypothetical protein
MRLRSLAAEQKIILAAVGVLVIFLLVRLYARYKGGNPLAALAKKLGFPSRKAMMMPLT